VTDGRLLTVVRFNVAAVVEEEWDVLNAQLYRVSEHSRPLKYTQRTMNAHNTASNDETV